MRGNGAIYLNNAATCYPKAPGVVEAVMDAMESIPLHPGRSGFKTGDPLDICRRLIAEMLGVENPHRIILCSNSTHALNMAIKGFPFNRGDRIITSATEHNSVLRPLNHRMDEMDLLLDIIPADSQGRIDMEKAVVSMEKPARMIVLNHASNVTGAVNPAEELFKTARGKGITTVLDASQTMGCIPVRAEETGADMIAFTGHKSLMGPSGTGGLYIGESLDLNPVLTGGTGVRSDLTRQPNDYPVKFESGTPNLPAFAGLARALRWKKENPEYTNRTLDMLDRLEMGISQNREIKVIRVEGRRTPVLSMTFSSIPVEEAGFILQESFGIICRSGLHCAPLIHRYVGSAPDGTLRLSLSINNTPEEMDYVIESMERLAKIAV